MSSDVIFSILGISDSEDLLGHIDALVASSDDFIKTRDRLSILFVPSYIYHGSGDVKGFIRGMLPGYSDLDAYIYGIGAVPLYGTIQPILKKELHGYIRGLAIKDLYGDISPIPGVDLIARIKAYKYKDLLGEIYGIPPVDLYGFIRPTVRNNTDVYGYINPTGSFSYLYGEINPEISKDLYGYIKSMSFVDLPGNIFGYNPVDLYGEIQALATNVLRASIQGKSYEVPKNLYGFIRTITHESSLDLIGAIIGSAKRTADLDATFNPIPGVDLHGYIEAHFPSDLSGVVYGTRTNRVFDRLTVNLGPTKDLIGSFTPTGGYKDLVGIVRGRGHNLTSDLYGTIDGYGQQDLIGIFTPKRWSNLLGTIQPKSLNTLSNLQAKWNAVFAESLTATIYPNTNSKELIGEISPSGDSETLQGYIRPNVSAFHDVILLNSMMHKNLYGVIYSGLPCAPSSAFGDISGNIRGMQLEGANLGGFIQPKPYNTLLYGTITGGFSFPGSSDLTGTISSTGEFTDLSATIFSPISYLRGLINGIGSSSSDLGGTFTPKEWNVFLKGTVVPRLLIPKSINSVSTEVFRKNISSSVLQEIRIKFASQGYEYVRSDLADNTFLVNGNTWGVRLSVMIPKLNPDGYIQDMVEEKVKVFFDISSFHSFDEAMRYFIDFIAYGAREDLYGEITPTGGFSELYAKIIATDPNTIKNLSGKVYPVDLSLVTLYGSLNAVGGLLDLRAVISSITGLDNDLQGTIYGYAQNDLEGYINSI